MKKKKINTTLIQECLCIKKLWLLLGSSVHGVLQARIFLSPGKIFPTQGLNPGLLHYKKILYHNWVLSGG